MDAASILVLVLCVGGFALLVWFEMNSRANTAKESKFEHRSAGHGRRWQASDEHS